MSTALLFLDNAADPLMWATFFGAAFSLGMYVIRHENHYDFATERYAYERGRSPSFLKGLAFFSALFCTGWGLDDVNEGNTVVQRVVVKQKVLPDLAEAYKECRNKTPDTENAVCRKYVQGLHEAHLLQQGKIWKVKHVKKVVYTKIPYDEFMNSCLNRTNGDNAYINCRNVAITEMRGLVARQNEK